MNTVKSIENLTQELRKIQKSYDEVLLKNLIYEKILSSSTDGFLVVDQDGNIVDINIAYCKYLGVDRDKTIGMPVLSVIQNSKMPEVISKNLSELDVMHTFPDGMRPSGEQTVCVSRVPVINNNGQTVAAVATIKFSHHTINLAQTLQRLEQEINYYRSRLSRFIPEGFDDLPSESIHFAEAKRMAIRFSNSDLPILLLGETGVGKEVFANAIHLASSRVGQPFVCINCASIPEDLLESELFGYVEGAFTGSKRSGKKGKFEIADGGTIFLDEIGEMPIKMQSKLLRVLQSQEVEKLGSEKSVKVNVRIIAATNVDLLEGVQNKTFRMDLYYRLNVLTITIPPLRNRAEDIPLLANGILNELVSMYGRKVSISTSAMNFLKQYPWPGNIRELRNVIGRGFMMTDGNEILPEHFPALSSTNSTHAISDDTIHEATRSAQQQLIIKYLLKFNGNFSKTAKKLGIHRTTLYSYVSAMGINVQRLRSNLEGTLDKILLNKTK